MEHYSIHLTQTARIDIRDIGSYVSSVLREPLTAEKLVRRFIDAIFSLETMPERYALVSDQYLASQGFRALSVGDYLVFYTITPGRGRVTVSRILYGRRDWVNILTKEF